MVELDAKKSKTVADQVIFDSVRYPWLKVALSDPESKTERGHTRTRIKRISFANGNLITDDKEVITALRAQPDVFEADGTGPHECPECNGRLHSIAALKRHMQSHIPD